MRHIATFCGQCNCGCPELFIDEDAHGGGLDEVVARVAAPAVSRG